MKVIERDVTALYMSVGSKRSIFLRILDLYCYSRTGSYTFLPGVRTVFGWSIPCLASWIIYQTQYFVISNAMQPTGLLIRSPSTGRYYYSLELDHQYKTFSASKPRTWHRTRFSSRYYQIIWLTLPVSRGVTSMFYSWLQRLDDTWVVKFVVKTDCEVFLQARASISTISCS